MKENFKEAYNLDDANKIDLDVYRFEVYDRDHHKYVFVKRKKSIDKGDKK